ncbi:hypothetical protein I7I48_00282 [Histoplasma ohiense]|nr:hypothetical protein I7I48_00282 [Histoplasma ohiense (nom. inval.)]
MHGCSAFLFCWFPDDTPHISGSRIDFLHKLNAEFQDRRQHASFQLVDWESQRAADSGMCSFWSFIFKSFAPIYFL